MGYFRNGFVFSVEPQHESIAIACPTCSLRGYKHKEGPLWLLDLWEKPNAVSIILLQSRWDRSNSRHHR